MNIKIQTALVLAICTVTGFVLCLALVLGYQRIEAEIHELGPNSAAIRDASRLKKLLSQWLLSTDLVLDGQTYMLNASQRQSDELLELIGEIRGAPLAADQREELLHVEYGIRGIGDLVASAGVLSGDERERRLADLAAEVDAVATPLIERVDRLEGRLRHRSRFLENDLRERRSMLSLLSWAAAVLYCIVVGLSWFWTVRGLVHPIERLSSAAERAGVDESFELEETGPDEVRRLTRNISTFVGMLQSAKERTEEEVRKRTEELVRVSAAKSEFLATMSHELRTPLNGIINMTELVLDTDLDQEQTEFAVTARNAAEALLALINDILDFSKIEARKLELDSVPLKVRDVVDGAVEVLNGVAQSKGVELACVVASDVPGVVVNDSMRLRQVITNLLSNALKFTSSGSVVVDVSRIGEEDGEHLILFKVTDTGIGIPPDRVDSLFQAFEQVDSSTTRKYGGTGLGLAISKQLAELMGGEIGVESEVGVGSTFWFTIRACSASDDELKLPDAARRRMVVCSTSRDVVADRLRGQLEFLGVATDSVLRLDAEEGAEIAWPEDRPAETDAVAVIVDPRGAGVSPTEALARLRQEPRLVGARFCFLEDLLRKHASDTEPLPDGVDRLPDPVKLDALRAWLVGAQQERARESIGDVFALADGAVRVLLAEDNPINQRVATKILEKAGIQVTVAKNGQEAVDALLAEPCDIVLMDCQMPVMDGWDATRLIRAHEAEGRLAAGCPQELPIVALTANALAGDREKCLAAGMSDYLTKPFKPRQLLEVVERSLYRTASQYEPGR